VDQANCTVIIFSPRNWGSLQRFEHFYPTTYSFDRNTQYAIKGAANHFYKALHLFNLAKEFSPRLNEDNAELEKNGYTDSVRSNELSALVEAIILEFYSSIDCTRHIVTTIYKNHRGVKQSTRKFFQAAFKGTVAETVPLDIREAFKTAGWYPGLRRIRDSLTHSDIGSCRLDKTTQSVSYMHAGLGDNKRAFVIKDIFEYMDTLNAQINQFTGKVFNCLNGTLLDKELLQMCGIFNGFAYSRFVKPSDAVDFNSGRCNPWFDSSSIACCPFADKCTAYKNKRDRVLGYSGLFRAKVS
jgi:hypothetical protein